MTMTDLLRAAKSALTGTVDSTNSSDANSSEGSEASIAPPAWPTVHAERQQLLGERQARVSAEAGPRVATLEAQFEALKLALKSARENWDVELGRLEHECAAARTEHTAAFTATSDAAIAPLATAWCNEPSRATALALIELLPTLAHRAFEVSDYPGNEIIGPCLARAFAAAIGFEANDGVRLAMHGREMARQLITLAGRKDVTAFERILRELESTLRAVDADEREQRAHGGRYTTVGNARAR